MQGHQQDVTPGRKTNMDAMTKGKGREATSLYGDDAGILGNARRQQALALAALVAAAVGYLWQATEMVGVRGFEPPASTSRT
jgi:hypothetical protein